jgi:hypothetical protein
MIGKLYFEACFFVMLFFVCGYCWFSGQPLFLEEPNGLDAI